MHLQCVASQLSGCAMTGDADQKDTILVSDSLQSSQSDKREQGDSLGDDESKRDNDTPVQPQTQAMGAAPREPGRGEIPVTLLISSGPDDSCTGRRGQIGVRKKTDRTRLGLFLGRVLHIMDTRGVYVAGSKTRPNLLRKFCSSGS